MSGKVVFTAAAIPDFPDVLPEPRRAHRAQLGVYLRLTGVPVPAVYNDSADEHGGLFIDSPVGASTRA